jgi:hypothetical protein
MDPHVTKNSRTPLAMLFSLSSHTLLVPVPIHTFQLQGSISPEEASGITTELATFPLWLHISTKQVYRKQVSY